MSLNKYYVILPVFNEEDNIEDLIISLHDQSAVIIEKIIIISSGCTDQTNEIISNNKNAYPNLELILEEKRTGKLNALYEGISYILKNEPINEYECILIFIDGDVKLLGDSLDNLITPLCDSTIAAVVGHPVQYQNKTKNLLTQINKENLYIWNEIRKKLNSTDSVWPISGYLFAVRLSAIHLFNAINKISEDAYFGITLLSKGEKIKYAEKALVIVKYPDNLSDYIKQKIRTRIGWVQIKRDYKDYYWELSNIKIKVVLKRIWETKCLSIVSLLIDWTLFFFAWIDYKNWRKYVIWDPIESTKKYE